MTNNKLELGTENWELGNTKCAITLFHFKFLLFVGLHMLGEPFSSDSSGSPPFHLLSNALVLNDGVWLMVIPGINP